MFVCARSENHALVSMQLQRALAARDMDLACSQKLLAELTAEAAELRRAHQREGINMDYLKNIVVQYMTFPIQSSEKLSLVPVIAMLLQFSRKELADVQRANQEAVASVMSMSVVSIWSAPSSAALSSSKTPKEIKPPGVAAAGGARAIVGGPSAGTATALTRMSLPSPSLLSTSSSSSVSVTPVRPESIVLPGTSSSSSSSIEDRPARDRDRDRDRDRGRERGRDREGGLLAGKEAAASPFLEGAAGGPLSLSLSRGGALTDSDRVRQDCGTLSIHTCLGTSHCTLYCILYGRILGFARAHLLMFLNVFHVM